jgi:leucyl aminopeptidase
VHVEVTRTGALASDADTVVVGVFEAEPVVGDFATGALQALLDSREARATFKHLAVGRAGHRRVILAGLGSREAFDAERARIAAALVEGRARELGARALCWQLPDRADDSLAAGLVEGTLLHAYRFERYRRAPADAPGRLERLTISADREIASAVGEAAVLASAQNRARDLGNTPANDLTPSALADYAAGLAARDDRVTVSVLTEPEIRSLGMGAFAAVSQGSSQEARLIRLEYRGAETALAGLIGKAVTFDSGGLALKPAAAMWEMKFDMGGGAAVIEAIAALAELDAPVHVLGVIGATENLSGPGAVKPGDIVRALDGTTIEVNNPDAEGRMVLADCLTYARREGCGRLVDIATLGPASAALGSTYAGLWSGDEALTAALLASSERTGELLWRLPLHPDYARGTKGRFADLTNRPEPREGLGSKAAEFLHHFAGETPWAHLDIAGMVNDVDSPYLVGKGATGFGVRLLVEFARVPPS